MDTVTVVREMVWKEATIGRLSVNGFECFTLEEPWLNNATGVSRIPPGEYICKIVMSPHFGSVYEVTNVPHRSHILIHPGNTTADTEGCLLLGSTVELLRDKAQVLESRKAVEAFMARMAGKDFLLKVINFAYGDG